MPIRAHELPPDPRLQKHCLSVRENDLPLFRDGETGTRFNLLSQVLLPLGLRQHRGVGSQDIRNRVPQARGPSLLAPISLSQPHLHGIPANLADEGLRFLPEQFLNLLLLP